MIVVVIMGIVILFAFPKAQQVYARTMVSGARSSIKNSYNMARAAARASNHITVLKRSGTMFVVERNAFMGVTPAKDTIGGYKNLSAQYGVTVSGDDSIRVDARGMLLGTIGTEYKWIITRSGYSDSVIINSYGRILR
jgi:Tfp pilus assembly protein FimT